MYVLVSHKKQWLNPDLPFFQPVKHFSVSWDVYLTEHSHDTVNMLNPINFPQPINFDFMYVFFPRFFSNSNYSIFSQLEIIGKWSPLQSQMSWSVLIFLVEVIVETWKYLENWFHSSSEYTSHDADTHEIRIPKIS